MGRFAALVLMAGLAALTAQTSPAAEVDLAVPDQAAIRTTIEGQLAAF